VLPDGTFKLQILDQFEGALDSLLSKVEQAFKIGFIDPFGILRLINATLNLITSADGLLELKIELEEPLLDGGQLALIPTDSDVFPESSGSFSFIKLDMPSQFENEEDE